MTTPSPTTLPAARQGGPPLLVPALAFAVLAGGAVLVNHAVPTPTAAGSTVLAYYRNHTTAVQIGGLLQFAAAIPLAIWAATIYQRMRTLGINAPGPVMGLAGGVLAAAFLGLSGLLEWVASRSTGGPGHVVPTGAAGRRSRRTCPARPARLGPAGLGRTGPRRPRDGLHADPGHPRPGRHPADRPVRRHRLDPRHQRRPPPPPTTRHRVGGNGNRIQEVTPDDRQTDMYTDVDAPASHLATRPSVRPDRRRDQPDRLRHRLHRRRRPATRILTRPSGHQRPRRRPVRAAARHHRGRPRPAADPVRHRLRHPHTTGARPGRPVARDRAADPARARAPLACPCCLAGFLSNSLLFLRLLCSLR